MNAGVRFLQFWYDFIVGDDWTISLAVVITLAITAWVAHEATKSFWFLLPLVIVVVLGASLWREARKVG